MASGGTLVLDSAELPVNGGRSSGMGLDNESTSELNGSPWTLDARYMRSDRPTSLSSSLTDDLDTLLIPGQPPTTLALDSNQSNGAPMPTEQSMDQEDADVSGQGQRVPVAPTNARPARTLLRSTARTLGWAAASYHASNDGTTRLCRTCLDLDLHSENFVIPSTAGPSLLEERRRSFLGERRMGTFRELREKAPLPEDVQSRPPCPLCELLIKSLGSHFNPATDGNPCCFLSWTTDGLARNRSRTIPLTNRLQIRWQKSSIEDVYRETSDRSYIVLAASEGTQDPGNGAQRNATANEDPKLFLGRLLTTLTSAVIDNFDLAKSWLKVCTQNHGPQCAAQDSLRERSMNELVRSAFFAVVDVEDLCLRALPRGPELPRYVAMSYTWGVRTEDGMPFRCKKENYGQLCQKNGINLVTNLLPRAIKDAISLTKKLEIRYLWVDSLCIVQDDGSSWMNNAAAMDVIYGNATLTICAADDGATDPGLRALHPPSTSRYDRHAEQHVIEYQRSPSHHAMKLILSHPSESYIARTRWDHRGWTLQERLLSPRCLIFVAGRMYFQCRSTTMSEDIHSDSETAVAGWSVELHGAPAQILEELKRNPIQVYKKLVEMYTWRDLTRQNDILDAFNGITNLIKSSLESQPSGCDMIYGLPNSHFDWALLWSSDRKLYRRNGEESRHRVTTDFPSWSWCGWKGEFADGRGWKAGKMSYKRSTILGSETEFNLFHWLQNRTWIAYYITNGQGRLRLVWDPMRHNPNHGVEDWSGYKSPIDWYLPRDDGVNDGVFPKYDLHGRRFDHSLPIKGRVVDAERHFQRTLPNCPPQVVVLDPGHDDSQDFKYTNIKAFDEPYLRFFTWSAKFWLVEADDENQFSRGGNPGRGLKRFAIIDKYKTFAGSCVLDDKWTEAARLQIPQEFIALSFARDFAADECSVPTFNNGPNSGADWQLYNVMMLEYCANDTHAIGYRAGIGKMYTSAFAKGLEPMGEQQSRAWFSEEPSGMYWKEIVLG